MDELAGRMTQDEFFALAIRLTTPAPGPCSGEIESQQRHSKDDQNSEHETAHSLKATSHCYSHGNPATRYYHYQNDDGASPATQKDKQPAILFVPRIAIAALVNLVEDAGPCRRRLAAIYANHVRFDHYLNPYYYCGWFVETRRPEIP